MRGRRFLIPLLALVQVVVLAASSLAAADRWLSLPLADGPYVLLVLGSDMGPPRAGAVTNGRADGIHVLVVSADRQKVSIISIPRDAYVPVRGFGTTKINAMLVKGPENARGTIEDLIGMPVDDWIVTGFDAMIIGIDAFDGVEVDVEQRLHDTAAQTDLQPGPQRLTGWHALAYTRDRKSRPDGDVGRSTGQAKLLAGMHRELIRDTAGSPARLVDFAAILRRHTVSSIAPEKLFRLGVTALQIDPANVAHVTLPGNNGMAGSASVYRLSDAAYGIIADVREDGVLAVLEDPPAEEG
jgi:polyisoprenyl-teichoic acid--peptidoglycan teichoic acid transferase